MKKINEIFYSVQGEGRNTGKACVFIRFSGCNIKCPFCDTQHEKGRFYSDEEILTEVRKYKSDLIVLTGGEPTLFIDDNLIDILHQYGFKVAIETNGTNVVNENIDFITLSPKFEFTQKAELKIKKCNELKVIFDDENDMSKYDDIQADFYYLQPCDTGNNEKNKEIIKKTYEYCLNFPKWRISLQTQKILNVR